MLVEDHAVFRQGLAFMLNREPDMEVVRQAGTLAEARQDLSGIDVAVVDLDLPDGSGIELITELRRANPEGMVLVLTGSGNQSEMAGAVEAGAAGVMRKTATVEETIKAIRRLSQGDMLMSPQEVVALLRMAMQQRAQADEARAVTGRLTPREIEVLHALARGGSDKEIARDLSLSTETVRTHMVNILGKLNASSRLQALVLAIRYGLVEV
jgi:DNA-binding NarL/FixJ family response regulator